MLFPALFRTVDRNRKVGCKPYLEQLEDRTLLTVTFQWFRQFGTGPSADFARAVDSSGNVYVAGSTGGVLAGTSSAGDDDVFVRKYDANGMVVWTQQFGTASNDAALGIAVDATGVYVAGGVSGTLSGQTSGGQDAFVRKYDASGMVVWTHQFGSAANDIASGITADASGIYVAGSAGDDAFVRKYDASGTELWNRQFGTADIDMALGVAADASGVYVAGQTFGVLTGPSSAGGADAFVRKYDTSGNEDWTRQFGTAGTDGAVAVAADVSGIYVAGGVSGVLPGQTGAGGQDAFVRKYDASGTTLWTRQFGSTANDIASGITADVSGIYVAGQTLGVLPGQTSAGSADAFLRKYHTSGTEVWTRQFGTTAIDAAVGVAVDAGGIYVAGFTQGALPDNSNTGGIDAFVAKLSEEVNDPPVNTVPGPQRTNRDTPLAFYAANGNLIAVADADAGTNPVQVTLTAVNGTLTLSRTTGLTFTSGDGSADAAMTFTGTLANVNAALDGLVFNPAGGFSGAASLTITTNDQGHTGTGGPLSDSDTVAITVNPASNPDRADLRVTLTDAPDPVGVGQNLTYTATVTNHGPGDATSVILGDLLPSSVTFVAATASQGTCTQSGRLVICDLGRLVNGASATVTIVVTPTQAGQITNWAGVVSFSQVDPNYLNNVAVAVTTVRNSLRLAPTARPGQPARDAGAVLLVAGSGGLSTEPAAFDDREQGAAELPPSPLSLPSPSPELKDNDLGSTARLARSLAVLDRLFADGASSLVPDGLAQDLAVM
jgi:uncharacterized repeat protein (TIGR01451 family)